MAQQPITNGNIRQKIREAQISGENISGWDVSEVTDMSRLFSSVRWNNFNQDLSAWNVSKVTNMREMFSGCRAFNNSLNSLNAWNVSNVTDMSKMFQLCQEFNQDLSAWNVSNVTNMSNMFSGCRAFNQDLSAWNGKVSNVTDMSNMFFACIAFNNSLRGWDVSNVTNMSFMFSGCIAFNNDSLREWNVSNVTDMCFMFSGCITFNQPLNWNVRSVRDMNFMFSGCSAFNQSLDTWDVSNVTNMRFMFNMCGNLRQDTVLFQQRIDPSTIGMDNPQVAQVAPVAPVAPVAEHTSVAFEIHNAFAKCASIREKYLEIIGQPHDYQGTDAEFQEDVHSKFTTNINALFTKKDDKKEEKLANFETVFDKVKGSLSTSTSTFKQLIAKSIYFVFSQGDEEFRRQYIITFLDETTNAYAATCVGSDTTSCVKGILERFVTAVGAASQIICSGGSCDETFKKLDVLFYKDEFIANLSSQWWEQEAITDKIRNMESRQERKENFIKYIEDEMRRLNVYNEDDLSKIQQYANNIDYAFEALRLGGRSGKTRKSKKSKKTKKSKKSKKSKKTKKSKKSKK